MSGALIGFAGAVGALGGVGINLVLRASYSSTRSRRPRRSGCSSAFYVVCAAVTWTVFLRRPRLPPTPAVVVEAESLVLEPTDASSANSSAR